MTGKADTFADYGDLTGFTSYIESQLYKGRKLEDVWREALNHGDNGVGASGKITAQEHTPMVALSPDLCHGHKHGDKVKVSINTSNLVGWVIASWEDDRPPSGEVNENTIVEFNPATCKALGLTPPGTFSGVTWEWA